MFEQKLELVIASDHGGYLLKTLIMAYLVQKKIPIKDLGTDNDSLSVDYPNYAKLLVKKVLQDNILGILICGTGIGMSISANRFLGIRATLCHDLYTAEMARKHNNSNVLVLGGRVVEPKIALKIVDTWLATEFEGGRHQKRLDMIDDNDY